uniref:Uncharacterized protein n=1 Tax=Castor canadensis TaxID=51338 RepID=A0A8C0XRD7_CASCN
MTLGAVHDSPTTAQRVPLQVPGEWAIWNIGQKLREQIVIIGEYRLAGQSKILRGTPNCLPIWPDTHPPSVTLCLAGMGAPGGTCRPTLCVPKFAALPCFFANGLTPGCLLRAHRKPCLIPLPQPWPW